MNLETSFKHDVCCGIGLEIVQEIILLTSEVFTILVILFNSKLIVIKINVNTWDVNRINVRKIFIASHYETIRNSS